MAPTSSPSLPWRETPLVESVGLSRNAGCKIHLKLENLQPSGSFKSRGIGAYLLARVRDHQAKGPDAAPIHFYSSSGGNAGIAAVHAASALQLPCTVVVPLATKARMIEKMRVAGARDVIQIGASWREADAYLREELLGRDPGGVHVPPFDHPDIWAGHSKLVDELVRQLGGLRPAAVVCSVGGGGLFCGLQMGLEKVGWTDVPILALETRGADSWNQTLDAGEMITLPGITSKATCLGATRCAEKAFEFGKRPNVRRAVLSDAEAARGCWRLADEERLLVELACGVNVALCYEKDGLSRVLGRQLAKEDVVVIVVCGGNDITIDTVSQLKEEFSWIDRVDEKKAKVNGSA